MVRLNRLVCTTLMLILAPLYPAASASDAGADKKDNLLVFIGQKVSLTEQPPQCKDCLIGNAHFVANYRILDTLHGNHRGGTITFDVFDHYGVPGFSKYDTVLLYVLRRPDGSWVHDKYQFNDLYKGVDDEWYTCGDPYARYPNATRTVHARPVQFAQPVSYPVATFRDDFVKARFPADYYDVRDGQAICKLATSAADVLKARMETMYAPRATGK